MTPARGEVWLFVLGMVPHTTSLPGSYSSNGRLASPNEGAHELPVDLRRDGVRVEAGGGQKFACVLRFVNAIADHVGVLNGVAILLEPVSPEEVAEKVKAMLLR